MTNEAIGAEIVAAVDVIAALWPGLVGEPTSVAQAWLWVIGDEVQSGEIAKAVRMLLREADRQYPPRPGEVLAKIKEIRQINDPRKVRVREAARRMLAEVKEEEAQALASGESTREIPKFSLRTLDKSYKA